MDEIALRERGCPGMSGKGGVSVDDAGGMTGSVREFESLSGGRPASDTRNLLGGAERGRAGTSGDVGSGQGMELAEGNAEGEEGGVHGLAEPVPP